MEKITVKIDGMMCGMCEAHICETIRNSFPNAKKVSASRKHGEATFLTDTPIDMSKLGEVISNTGYTFVSAESAPYQKHGIFG